MKKNENWKCVDDNFKNKYIKMSSYNFIKLLKKIKAKKKHVN
jgi:hypothetical protein